MVCIGDLEAEEAVCEPGVCAGREVTRSSGHDLIETVYPLEVLVAMETRQRGEPAREAEMKGL